MNTQYFFHFVWPILSKVYEAENQMSGPKSPYGYAPIFHSALASIHMDQPAELEIDTDKHPSHLRAMFNQFRNAWVNQAAIHHKRKEFQQERACRQNYYKLMQYECQLTPSGIKLQARAAQAATLRTSGRVEIETPVEIINEKPPTLAKGTKPGLLRIKDTTNLPSKVEVDLAIRSQEDTIMSVFGRKKPDPVIEDNPPTNVPSNEHSTENKYGLPIGPPPGFEDKYK